MTIELAQRLQRIRPSATVSITARAQRLREQGRDIIVLSVGEPDFPTPEHVKAAAAAALARNDTKYTPVDGSGPLKEAIVAKLKRDNGLAYTPEQVLVSTGAKQSCYNACLALLDAGDEAIVVAPCCHHELAAQIAQNAPLAVQAAKRAIDGTYWRERDAWLAWEADRAASVLLSEDQVVGRQAAAARRRADFQGR